MRRKQALPSRTPARVARAAPGRNRERPPEPQPAPVARPRPSRACCRSSPISSRPSPSCRTRNSAAPAARRSAISCFPSPASPAPASRRAPRAGRSSAASTSTASASSRTASAAAASPISARIISCRSIRWPPTRSRSIRGPATLRYGSTLDRRRRQRDQQPDSRRAAVLPGGAVPELRHCRSRRRSPMRSRPCVNVETRTAVSSRRPRRRRRHPARCRRRQFRGPCRRLSAARPTITHPELSLSVRPDPAVQRPAAELGGAGRRRVGRRLVHLPWRLHRRRDHAEQRALSHSRHRRRRSPDPHRRAPDQVHRPRASTGPMRRRSMRSASGPAPPTTSTTRSASPIPPISTTDGVRQTFTNKEQEGRVEVQLMPFNLRFAPLTTALGVQAGHQELTAPSPDDPGSRSTDCGTRTTTRRVAGYVFNEFKFTRIDQGADRRPHRARRSPRHDAGLSGRLSARRRSASAAIARNLHFTPKSVSVGLIQNLPWDLVGSITAQYVERAPKPAELFSRGAHDATATFDIGNPNLNIETAKSVEVGLRRATGPFRFEAHRLLHALQRLHLPPADRQ